MNKKQEKVRNTVSRELVAMDTQARHLEWVVHVEIMVAGLSVSLGIALALPPHRLLAVSLCFSLAGLICLGLAQSMKKTLDHFLAIQADLHEIADLSMNHPVERTRAGLLGFLSRTNTTTKGREVAQDLLQIINRMIWIDNFTQDLIETQQEMDSHD